MKLFNPLLGDAGEVIGAHFTRDLDAHGWDVPDFLPAEVAAQLEKDARDAAILQAAENLLNYREALRLADRLESERSGHGDSWLEQDIDELFDTEQQQPDVGTFLDGDMSNGGGVFYAGKVNEIHGPSESGKTMVLLAVAAQEIQAGNHVVMIDFEDDGRSIINRLRWVFALDREDIRKRFHYFRPDVAFNEQALAYIAGIDGVTLGIIDAITEGMSIAQLDGRNENEVATWYNDFPKKLAATGMAVVLVDHTSHDKVDRQIGSQHKKSAIDGVSYTAEPISPFTKGGRGHLRLKIAKDKIGSVRANGLPQGDGKQYWRGDFKINGTMSPDSPVVTLHGVDPQAFTVQTDPGRARDVKAVTMPTPAESQVLLILAEDGGWLSADGIKNWYNQGMEPKDPGRMDRTTPRKMAVKLIGKGLVERQYSGQSVSYRVTPDGLHSANAWVNKQAEEPQMRLEDVGFTKGSEPKGEPKGEPK